MKNFSIKKTLAFGAAMALVLLPMAAGAQFDASRGSSGTGLSTRDFYDVVYTILQYGLAILTILGVIGFVISGIVFITAGGAGKADDARKWLIYSIVGILVGLIGYIVIRLIQGLLIGNPGVS